MEDTQPNELPLSRKGSANIPRVHTTRPVYAPYRPRWQPPPIRAPFPSSSASSHELVIHLPPECHKRAPGSHNARKRWIEDQKYHLRTDRRLSVVSSRYLDRDNSVLFICRTQPAPQSVGHRATRDSIGSGPHHVHARFDQAPSLVKDSNSSLAQRSEPGPSRIEPISSMSTVLGVSPQRLDNEPSIPSSGLPSERHSIESPATEANSFPVEIPHADRIPRLRAAVRYTPPAESVIDLTSNHTGSILEEHTARWSTFRSGCVPVFLPPSSSDFKFLSPETSTDQWPRISQVPAQVVMQCKNIPTVPSNDTHPRLVHSNIRANDTVPIRLSEDHRQHGVFEAPRSSCPRSVVQEDEAEVLPSPPDCSPVVCAFNPACGNLPLRLGPHDKPRRILHDLDFTCIVTAHGIVDQVGTTSVLELDHNIRSPSLPYEEFVDDACILSHQGDPVIILGHVREQDQIAFLSMGHGRVSRHITLCRDWNTTKRPGVSSVTSLLSPLKFASGGYDHRVHLWDIAQDLSGASAVELAIKHTSLVNSLLPIVDTSHKLLSVGADRDIPIYDLSSQRVVQTLKVSCTPYHAHKTDSQSCTLLEVSHLETQFEIRDHRIPTQAVQTFGFLAEERRGRFEKADSWSHFVACGDRNGGVHLWDLRNISTEIAHRQCFNDPVVQVVNIGPRLLACSKRNELACIDLRGE